MPRLIRRFSEVLALLDRGNFEQKVNEAVTDALETLGSQASEKGKATITIAMDLTFDKGMVQIKPTLKSKLPEAESFSPTVLWVHDGAFSTQHPSQTDMFSDSDKSERATASTAAG